MTSLAAQSQFGTLIDTSQRQPVAVTRRGRPIAVVLSYADYQQSKQTIPWELAALISENHPLRGAAAGDAVRRHLANLDNLASEDGLVQNDITRMINDNE